MFKRIKELFSRIGRSHTNYANSPVAKIPIVSTKVGFYLGRDAWGDRELSFRWFDDEWTFWMMR